MVIFCTVYKNRNVEIKKLFLKKLILIPKQIKIKRLSKLPIMFVNIIIIKL